MLYNDIRIKNDKNQENDDPRKYFVFFLLFDLNKIFFERNFFENFQFFRSKNISGIKESFESKTFDFFFETIRSTDQLDLDSNFFLIQKKRSYSTP